MTQVRGFMSQKGVKGTISQMNVRGSISQKGVKGSIVQTGHVNNAPVFVSAEVGSDSANTLILTYNRYIYPWSIPAISDYSLSFSGGAVSVSSVIIAGDSEDIFLILDRAIAYGETGTLSYTPGTSPIKSLLGDLAIPLSDETVTNNVAASYPSALANRFFWYDPSDLTTITKDGGNIISRFNDKLGNGNDLVTGSALWTANTALFNGTNQYLATGAIAAMTQPTMIYMIVKQVAWVINRIWVDGLTGRMWIYQTPSTPDLRQYADVTSGRNSDLAVDTWGIVRALFDGANSKLIVNDLTPITGNVGTADAGGFTLGSSYNPSAYSNIQVKDVIAMPSTESETEIYNWLVTRLPA